MNPVEFQNLKNKIEQAKTDKAKAEGKIESLEKKWKEEWSCFSVDDVEKKLAETIQEIKQLEQQRNEIEKEINSGMGQ